MNECRIYTPPVYVGYYDLGEGTIQQFFKKKPTWLHRTMTRILLGWKWVDKK